MTDLQRQGRRILSHVARGESVLLTEHGRTVARIVPEVETQLVSLEEFRRSDMTDEAILAAIDEGRE